MWHCHTLTSDRKSTGPAAAAAAHSPPDSLQKQASFIIVTTCRLIPADSECRYHDGTAHCVTEWWVYVVIHSLIVHSLTLLNHRHLLPSLLGLSIEQIMACISMVGREGCQPDYVSISHRVCLFILMAWIHCVILQNVINSWTMNYPSASDEIDLNRRQDIDLLIRWVDGISGSGFVKDSISCVLLKDQGKPFLIIKISIKSFSICNAYTFSNYKTTLLLVVVFPPKDPFTLIK